MTLSINTNPAATVSATNLAATNQALQKSLQRLSSGSRIVSSSDDAGGLAVSMKLGAALRRTEATNINLQNAQSFLKTQDGVLSTAHKVLMRMAELAVLAQDVTKSSADRQNYQTEFSSLQTQLINLSYEKFNGVTLFATTSSSAQTITVYTNEDSTITTSLTLDVFTSTTTGVGSAANSSVTILEITSAASATSVINSALQNVATMRARNGAESSRINFAMEQLITNRNNLELANSRIVDVDVAAESTQLARFTILQQAGTAMLAQANQSTQAVLRLLQG
ncbi:MAG: flagellin [Chthoniobacterales bacterium]|nr:flagellin [Chthoniobacterales bacterium]